MVSVVLSLELLIDFAIIEDDQSTRAALICAIEAAGEWNLIGEAATYAEGEQLIGASWDLLLVDIGLPDGCGTDLIRSLIATECPRGKIVVISMFGDERSVVQAIRAGADGYLLKGTDLAEVPSAVDHVMQGLAPISPQIAGHLLHLIRDMPGQTVDRSKEVALTPREFQILSSIAKGLTYKEVALQQNISHHTVNDHLKAVYRKLSVTSRGEAIYTATRMGLLDLARDS